MTSFMMCAMTSNCDK